MKRIYAYDSALLKIILSFLIFLIVKTGFSQILITGKITDSKGNGIPFVNIYIEGSYDGSSSDQDGVFSFKTLIKGGQIIVFSCVGYENNSQTINLKHENVTVNAVLPISETQLEYVSVTAGSFEASDEKKAAILKPLDIVTTAGGAADISQVMQMLPGTQNVGESEGLFVRGGSASETKTFIDGMLVQSPYFSSVPDVPQRGRFHPYLFKGTLFSTGGYSAQYGKALSSALILNSVDEIDTTTTSIGVSIVGGSLYHANKWEKSSLSIGGDYANLKPYFSLDKQLTEWVKEPEAFAGELIYRVKPNKRSILKIYSNYAVSNLSMNYEEFIDTTLQKSNLKLQNKNLFLNTSYKSIITNNMDLFCGFSLANNQNNIEIDDISVPTTDQLVQGRAKLTRYFNENNNFIVGGEVQSSNNRFDTDNKKDNTIHDFYSALFIETNFFLTKKFASSLGLRLENSSILNKSNIAPRVSLAYKTGLNSQISLAYGRFFQNTADTILINFSDSDFENSSHYIANYQWIKDERTFRIELYDKEYDNLVKYSDGEYSNNGYGYARGVDVFWRDQETMKNTDYWISYSFIKSKRDYLNYQGLRTPSFVSDHTLSLIYKYFINNITTSVSLSYTYSSGRNYYRNAGNINYREITPEYHNLSLSISKLASVFNEFAVFFLSIDNILNRQNVFAYRYSSNGEKKIEIGPPNLRSFFIGCFIAID